MENVINSFAKCSVTNLLAHWAVNCELTVGVCVVVAVVLVVAVSGCFWSILWNMHMRV